MPFIEAPTTFYLGRKFDPNTGRLIDDVVYYDSRDLVTHSVVVGMTGSGKTGLCITLLEEAAMDNIPAIIIDPKGDITNLLLTFPNLSPQEFLPWINEDEARRAGLSPQEYAEDVAQRWRDGLASWGITPQRIQTFKNNAKFSIFTPGSDAGLPISIVDALQPPREGWAGKEEQHRERISGVVTALIALTGKKVDTKDREHVLISNIIEHAWMQGMPLTIGDIILQVQQPPFNRLGVFDVDTFFPEKDRFKLAIELNNIIASPSFQTWLQGESLDIRNLLYTPQGQPRVSIFYIAHLSDVQRSFIITLILENMLAWMRTLGGVSSLRAILYFDEVFGHFPPYPKNPPTKEPLLRLLKQARAFGIGMVLATQNPGDLDYKGLSNAGTWFIGKLQTDNDKRKVIDGLATASSAESAIDIREMDDLISTISPRVFVMNNVHDSGGPILVHTRWAMSYLRGPLTRSQVSILMQPQRNQIAAYGGYNQQQQYTQQQQYHPAQPYQPAQQYHPAQPQPGGPPPTLPGFTGQQAPTPQGFSQAPGTPPPPPSLPGFESAAPPPNLPDFGAPQTPQPPVQQQQQFNPNQFQAPNNFGQPNFQQTPYSQPVQAAAPPPPQVQQTPDLPNGYSYVPPSLSATVTQYYLPANVPSQQALLYWERQNNQRRGRILRQVLLYQPFLLAQCQVRFMDRKKQINLVEVFAYHVLDVSRSGLVHWEEHVASTIDSRSVANQPFEDGAAFGELPPGLTDRKRVTSLEKEIIDYIYRTSGIVIPVNSDLGVFGFPGRPYQDFQSQVFATARQQRDAEIDKITQQYEKQFDKLDDQYRKEVRELDADQAALGDLGRENLATMGEAALSLMRGRTTYTLSRVARVRRYQSQAREDVEESQAVLQELNQQMNELQQRFDYEIAQISDKWVRIANNNSQDRITPLKKDIHTELFGIGWKPYYYVLMDNQSAIISAWQGPPPSHLAQVQAPVQVNAPQPQYGQQPPQQYGQQPPQQYGQQQFGQHTGQLSQPGFIQQNTMNNYQPDNFRQDRELYDRQGYDKPPLDGDSYY